MMDTELRKTPRRKPQQLIYVEFGQDNGGMMRDLSENGMGFRSVGPMRRGAKVPFSFSFSAGDLLDGQAELIWTDPEGRAGGLRFVDADRVRGQIRNWLAREEYPAIAEDDATRAAATQNTFEELGKELRVETPPASAVMTPDEGETLVMQKNDAESTLATPLATSNEIPAPPLAPAPFSKEINFGLEPLAFSQTTPAETKWVENVTLTWVVAAMVILTLLAAGLVFHHELGQSLIWLGARILGSEHADAVPPEPVPHSAQPTESGGENAASATANSPTANSPTDSTVPPVSSREKQTNQSASPVLPGAGTGDVKPRSAPTGVRQSRGQEVEQANAGSSLKNQDNGQSDLQHALQILRGEDQSGNISQAVRLLWLAVERGNSDAEVMLADLYRRGEGVTQSCDQTHVLLNAAAKKGNSLAKARLIEIARSGCP